VNGRTLQKDSKSYGNNFLLVDIGDSGRQSDGGVFSNGNIGHAINEHTLNLPEPTYLPGNESNRHPYVFVGDEAFPLKTNLIKPYSRSALSDKRRIFNYRLSRSRRVIENTFGICASRFRILRRSMVGKVEHVTEVTKAIVVLHNFLIDDRNMYCPLGFADDMRNGVLREGSWRHTFNTTSEGALINISRVGSNNFSFEAKTVRDNLCNYFLTAEGSVPWQHDVTSSTLDIFDRQ